MLLWPPPFTLTDHLVLWYVGHLVASGDSPYRPGAWIEGAQAHDSPHLRELAANGGIGVWPYPPWTGFAFAPVGVLPPEVGAWILHAAFILGGLLAALLIAAELEWSSEGSRALGLVLFIAFQPFAIAARWGQFTAFPLLGTALLLRAVHRGSIPSAVAGALLLALKPSITVLVGLVAVALLVQQRRWRALGAAAGTVVVVVAATWLRYPEWLGVASTGAADRIAAFARFASTWSLAIDLVPSAWVAVGAAAALLATALAIWGTTRLGAAFPAPAMLAGAAIATLAVLPYVLTYDHLLLGPALLVAVAVTGRAQALSRGVLLLGIVLAVGVVPWVAYLTSIFRPTQAFHGVVPLLFALVFAAVAAVAVRPSAATISA